MPNPTTDTVKVSPAVPAAVLDENLLDTIDAEEATVDETSLTDEELALMDEAMVIDGTAEEVTDETLSAEDEALLSEISTEIEAEEMRAETYKEADAGADVKSAEEVAAEAPKKARKAREATPAGEKKPREPRPTFEHRSDALLHRIGGRENLLFVSGDLHLDPGALAQKRDDFLAEVNSTAKKVQEKVINLFAAANGKAKLSEYSKIAINLLAESETTSKAIYEAMLAAKYSTGTARSQSQQMMNLLPLVGIATRDKNVLKLNKDSVLFVALTKTAE